ncbi:MAG TPA: methyltransferase domain-containing protein [Candidatus Paceibacterota bacterium]|nr:methyltransferase domain-containing protein [Verrucomicrobiota bacterium]HRY48727.1 methyltransferase domain-containing protein [Candidatus Paceibacterota bacterium]HSA00559.1 methyltransferase domain-containing protein [Candidatus Paceibacterota bacterium]
MKTVQNVTLKDVQAVYSGPEGDLWELIMGEQIHMGGFRSSLDLADRAGIQAGTRGIDLCCCNGAGMRFLIRFRQVASMCGVDATPTVLERAAKRCQAEGLEQKVMLVQADVCDTGLPAGMADFVWGEDAWCYVADKSKLIAEAVRLVKPQGTLAFTDWIEGPAGLTDDEAVRFMKFMKFPSLQDLTGYRDVLTSNHCQVLVAVETGRFSSYVDLYLDMLNRQLTYDALRIIGFDQSLMQAMASEMMFMQKLAHAGKIAQGLFVARKLSSS